MIKLTSNFKDYLMVKIINLKLKKVAAFGLKNLILKIEIYLYYRNLLIKKILGGENGIRTHDRVSSIHAFQACAFNHSATSPKIHLSKKIQECSLYFVYFLNQKDEYLSAK